MVLRKVEHRDEGPQEFMKAVFEQLTIDRAAMVQLQGAIEAVAKVVNKHDGGMATMDTRLDEQTRMRLDDHR